MGGRMLCKLWKTISVLTLISLFCQPVLVKGQTFGKRIKNYWGFNLKGEKYEEDYSYYADFWVVKNSFRLGLGINTADLPRPIITKKTRGSYIEKEEWVVFKNLNYRLIIPVFLFYVNPRLEGYEDRSRRRPRERTFVVFLTNTSIHMNFFYQYNKLQLEERYKKNYNPAREWDIESETDVYKFHEIGVDFVINWWLFRTAFTPSFILNKDNYDDLLNDPAILKPNYVANFKDKALINWQLEFGMGFNAMYLNFVLKRNIADVFFGGQLMLALNKKI